MSIQSLRPRWAVPLRPSREKRTVRLTLACALAGAVIAAVGAAPDANALPGQCAGGYGMGNGGQFCDFDACHVPSGRVPTDSDPATPC